MKNQKRAHNFKDLTGLRFGMLTVVDFFGMKKIGSKNRSYWNCICDCGSKTTVTIHNLSGKSRKTNSCGCSIRQILVCDKIKNGTNESYGAMSGLYNSYRFNAHKRKLCFDINREQFFKITKGNCFYCNKHPSNIFNLKVKTKNKIANYTYNGIDRINNDKGYTPDNIVSCCTRCNTMKMDMNINDSKMTIKKIYDNLNLQKL